MADIPYGRDYPDPIWCDEDGQPMPPVGAELLDDIRAFLRRFVVYPSDHELIAHTLWIAHCWFMEAWDSTPRIAFLSPEPGSGKSRALEVTEPLVPRPVHAINCTPAYLFRRVADPVGRPTVLYDECDTLFGPKAKEHEEIRGVINAGHRKGAVAGRCVIRGKIVETEELPAYCAVALAGLDDLPDTIMSRSIVVRMRRRAPTEPVEPWRPRVNGPEAEKLHDRLANWAAAINPLESGWPAMPDGVTDRRADVWESLVAVADTAGGHWPKTARATAETDATANRGAKPSIGVLLLRDIRRVFSDRDRMRTSDILTGLNRMEEGPWGPSAAATRSTRAASRPGSADTASGRSSSTVVANHPTKGIRGPSSRMRGPGISLPTTKPPRNEIYRFPRFPRFHRRLAIPVMQPAQPMQPISRRRATCRTSRRRPTGTPTATRRCAPGRDAPTSSSVLRPRPPANAGPAEVERRLALGTAPDERPRVGCSDVAGRRGRACRRPASRGFGRRAGRRRRGRMADRGRRACASVGPRCGGVARRRGRFVRRDGRRGGGRRPG